MPRCVLRLEPKRQICPPSTGLNFVRESKHQVDAYILMPASLSNFTACFTSSELCRLCRRRSLLSANVCAPMLTRFIGRRLSMFVNSGVMSSGLHSIVISAFLSTSYTLFIYRNSLVSSASSSNEGVPPPRYIVENGSRI